MTLDVEDTKGLSEGSKMRQGAQGAGVTCCNALECAGPRTHYADGANVFIALAGRPGQSAAAAVMRCWLPSTATAKGGAGSSGALPIDGFDSSFCLSIP